jgi:hypothetical protein
MRRPTTLTALLACLLALAALPAGAHANATDDRIARECQHSLSSELTGSYTKAQLRHALRNIPGDVLEYSGCYDTIRQATLSAASRGGPGSQSGGDGSTGAAASGGIGGTNDSGNPGAGGGAAAVDPNTPAHTGTKAPVAIAGAPIEPGELPSIGRDAHELPGALVALLGMLGLAALTPAALTIGRRVVARRRA